MKYQTNEDFRLHVRVRLIMLGIMAACKFSKKSIDYTNLKYPL